MWKKRTCVLLLCLVTAVLAQDDDEGITFPSGEVFYPVDESELDQATIHELADPKNTGSHIYEYDPAVTHRKFTLNLYEKNFKSSTSNYYRAHPTFSLCLQRIYSYVLTRASKTIKISSGYQTLSDVGGATSRQADYARSGCGVTLAFQDGQTGEPLLDIAKGAIHHCINLFGDELRDLGVIMLSDGVHVHMTGPEDVTTHFAVDGYTGMTQAEFEAWAWDALDQSIDPVKPPECKDLPAMGDGESYPEGVDDPGTVVGGLDKPITRDNHEDFKHLVQFAGSNIEFDDCDEYLDGNAPDSRCSNRLLSPRLYNRLRPLQKMVRKHIAGNKLKVQKAWTEETLTNDETSLHLEGRAAQIKLSQDNSAANLEALAKQALCSGLDYVKNHGDHILVAVRKQASIKPHTSDFDEAQVLHVLPPSEDKMQYELVTEDNADFPLLDGSDEDEVLGEYAKLGQFKSSSLRYMRLDPLISRCYDSIMRHEAKWTGTDTPVQINVVSSFMGAEELEEIGPELDPRGYSPTLGHALQVAYDESVQGEDTDYNIHRLARIAIQQCAPIFFLSHRQMGVGFYDDGLFIDMRDEFEFWQGGSQPLVPGTMVDNYNLLMEDRYYAAIEGRTINPTNPKEAAGREVIPQPQSPDYEYQPASKTVIQTTLPPTTTPQACVANTTAAENGTINETCTKVTEPVTSVELVQSSEEEDCVPQTNTQFCSLSKDERNVQVKHIWKQMKRKHMTRDENDIKQALEGCFGACGTCVKGWIYEEKTKHCDNLLHWMPFRMLNTKHNVSTMYQKDNLHMHDLACRDENMCVYNGPLYAILGDPLYKLYQPYPGKSIEEELYGVNDNPLPVYELAVKIHAIEAQGRVTVYVANEEEIKDLRSPLKVAMAYNKNVTFVQVYVDDTEQVGPVEKALQIMVSDWVANTHTEYTREAVVPFDVAGLPSGIQKRSLEEDFHTQLMLDRRHFERIWWIKQFN